MLFSTIRVTGIGSLPFTDEAQALDHVFTNYTWPFLPELPQASMPLGLGRCPFPPMLASAFCPDTVQRHLATQTQGEIVRIGQMLDGMHGHQAPLLRSALWRGFLQQVVKHQAEAIKLQVIGPNTSAMLLAALAGCPMAWPQIQGQTLAYIGQLSLALIKQLIGLSPASKISLIWDDGDTFIRLDDRARAAYLGVMHEISTRGAMPGIHSCTPQNIAPYIEAFSGMALAVDAHVINLVTTENNKLWSKFFSHGGVLVAGIVDTRPNYEAKAHTARLVGDLLQMLNQLGYPSAGQLAFSGGCGTGLRDVAFEKQLVATLLAAAGARCP